MADPSDTQVREYHDQVQAWLADNATPRRPADLWSVNFTTDESQERAHFAAGVEWQRKLFDAGYAGITWPAEYGGGGGASWQQRIFQQQAATVEENAGFVRATIAMLGPTLLRHGTDEQKETFLPKLLSAELTFCQLFSEPGAGSDLAGLATSAVLDGDEYVVNGQKVWNSAAQFCDWGFLLARTNPDVPKHQGISFFLVDMNTPGIEVRPLVQMNGSRHFNEVFFSDVRIPTGNLVGELHAGWGPARTVLSNESAFIGRGGGPSLFDSAQELSRVYDRIDDAVHRQKLVDIWAREKIQGLMAEQIVNAVRQGKPPPIDGALIKLFAAETRRRLGNIAMETAGPHSLTNERANAVWAQSQLALRFSISIGGGTNEVQRNNLAERSLGLPREPRSDKDLPWRDVPR